jgi:hypothetical protein
VSGVASFAGILRHELTHTLGFAHSFDCPGQSGYQSVMNYIGSVNEARNYRDDLEGMRAKYVSRSVTTNLRTSSTGVSPWFVDGYAPASAQSLFRFTGTSSGDSSTDGLSMVDRGDYGAKLFLRDVQRNWYGPIAVPTSTTFHYSAVARSSDAQQFLLVWLGDETVTASQKTVYYRIYNVSTGSWTAATQIGGYTVSDGVYATYDMNSGVFIISFLDTNGQIVLRTLGAGSTNLGYGEYAMDGASIACANPYLVYPNCVLSFADQNTWAHANRWATAYVGFVNGVPQVVLGPVHAGPYVMTSTPVVAARNVSDFPFELGFHQADFS